MIQKILTYFEQQAFGVCTSIGDRFNVSTTRIRLFFIYSSFLAVGFPIFFYFMAAFVLDIRRYFKMTKKNLLRDI